MYDLNSKMFYKAKFSIESISEQSCDLLWTLLLEIRRWTTSKLNKNEHVVDPQMKKWTSFKFGGRLYDMTGLNRFFAESVSHQIDGDIKAWACRITEKPEAESVYAPREWVTEIGFQKTSAQTAEISYTVSYRDHAGFIGFCQPDPKISLPRVIRALCDNKSLLCSVGPQKLTCHPIKLNSGDYPDFSKQIFCQERKLPIVYISPKCNVDDSDNTELLVSPESVAESVAANALVYYSDSFDFTREMNYLGNDAYSCYGGAIRVYRPQANPEDTNDFRNHRYLPASFIQEHGADKIIDLFRRALAQDTHFYEELFGVDSCRKLNENHQHKLDIINVQKESEEFMQLASDECTDAENKLKVSESENKGLKKDINDLRNENHNLRAQIDYLKEHAENSKQFETAVNDIRHISEYPNSPEAIAKYFETLFPDRIEFTERGRRSLSTCKTRSDILWEALYHIAVDLLDCMRNDPAHAYEQFKIKTGWECSRGEGRNTHLDSKLMKHYFDNYKGNEINIETHVKYGVKESDPKFIRVYLCYNPKLTDKIIIGHCGTHLENYSTKKIK